jgi:hypothetical protein
MRATGVFEPPCRGAKKATSPQPGIRTKNQAQQITKPAEAIAATGSDVFTHWPRLFGFLADAPLTPA